MEYILPVLILALMAVGLLALVGKRRQRKQAIGTKTVDREERPRAEKQQMDTPQEEFIDETNVPSKSR